MCIVCPGYEGENCQVDIDECEQHPCDNDGECFQRSDVLNYGSLPELGTAGFNYEEAAGFICRCLPGFSGNPDSQPKTPEFLCTLPHELHCEAINAINVFHFCRRQLLHQRGRV